MRQLIKFLLIFIILISVILPSSSALKGNLEYKIPIDYSQIDKEELDAIGANYYDISLNSAKGKINDDVTSALNIYTILSNKDPENIIYAIRLGKLYEIVGKDRHAKGNYFRAMGIDQSRPEPYYYLSEFFYKKEQYRRAYKMLLRAIEHGYNEHANAQSRLEELNKKLGIEKSKSDNQ